MQFKHRLLLVALAILVFTLLLSSLLSLASFDKIYSASLIATYEVSGKSLHRKIQASLRFGKPLTSFPAMARLLDETRERDAAIGRIDVVGPDKRLLYTTGGEAGGAESPYAGAYPGFAGPAAQQITTRLIAGRYVTFMPLHDRDERLVGYLNLEFPRRLVYQRLQALAWDNLRTLGPLMVAAALILILLIRLLVARPIERRVERLAALTGGDAGGRPQWQTDARGGMRGDEFDELFTAVTATAEAARNGAAGRQGAPAGRSRWRGFRWRILFAITLVVVIGQGIYAVLNIDAFRQGYLATLQQQSMKLGDYLRQDIESILGLGIPLEKLVRIDASLARILAASPDIEWIEITDRDHRAIYHVDRQATQRVEDKGRRSAADSTPDDSGIFHVDRQATHLRIPISDGESDAPVGFVEMRISLAAVHATSLEIVWDIASVILVSLMIAFVFLDFYIRHDLTEPLHTLSRRVGEAAASGGAIQRDGILSVPGIVKVIDHANAWLGRSRPSGERERPGRQQEGDGRPVPYYCIRPFVFLFFIAYNLPLSFFPMFVRTLYQPLWGLAPELLIGLPISLFMLVFALSMLLAGRWIDRAGWYRPLLIGTTVFMAGFVLTAFADSYPALILYRAITAVGLGLGFMAFQQFVVVNTDSGNRQVAFGTFLGAFFAGEIVGTVIGGILVDRLGYSNIFLFSGILSLLALIGIARFFRRDTTPHGGREGTAITFGQIMAAVRDREFLAVMILQAIPAKIALVGFLMYFVPLYLAHLGAAQSDIARIVMCYALTVVVAGQAITPRLPGSARRKYPIFAGGLITGCAMILSSLSADIHLVLLAVALLGVAHSLSLASLVSLVAETRLVKTLGIGAGMGVFRFWERAGNVAGPFVMAGLIAVTDYRPAVAILGGGTLFSSLLYLYLLRGQPGQDGR